jgi:hypothetical protein
VSWGPFLTSPHGPEGWTWPPDVKFVP